MKVDLKNIKEAWALHLWSREQVERFIAEEAHSFDVLIREFNKTVNRMPFLTTDMTCSGHIRLIMTSQRTGKLLSFGDKLKESIARRGIRDGCEETKMLLLGFQMSKDEGLKKFANEAVKLIESVERGEITANDAADAINQVGKLILQAAYELVLQEGIIALYVFSINKFTREMLTEQEKTLRDELSSKLDQIFVRANKRFKKSYIETIIVSQDAHHTHVVYRLKYKLASGDQVIEEDEGRRTIRLSSDEWKQYEREMVVLWTEIESLVTEIYKRIP